MPQNFLKSFEKGIDKLNEICYNKRVVPRGTAEEKILYIEKWTVWVLVNTREGMTITWVFYKQKIRKSRQVLKEQSQRKMSEGVHMNTMDIFESLILAQDERWRRA